MIEPPSGATTGSRPETTAAPDATTTPADPSTAATRGGRPSDTTGPIVLAGRTWNQAVVIGIAAFIVSRLCLLVGAGVRAAQITVDASENLEPSPVPRSAW